MQVNSGLLHIAVMLRFEVASQAMSLESLQYCCAKASHKQMPFKVKSLLAKVEPESVATEAKFDRELLEEHGDPFAELWEAEDREEGEKAAELWDGNGSSRDRPPARLHRHKSN